MQGADLTADASVVRQSLPVRHTAPAGRSQHRTLACCLRSPFSRSPESSFALHLPQAVSWLTASLSRPSRVVHRARRIAPHRTAPRHPPIQPVHLNRGTYTIPRSLGGREILVKAVRRDKATTDDERGLQSKRTRSDAESRRNYLCAFSDSLRVDTRSRGQNERIERRWSRERETIAGAGADVGASAVDDRAPSSATAAVVRLKRVLGSSPRYDPWYGSTSPLELLGSERKHPHSSSTPTRRPTPHTLRLPSASYTPRI